MNQYVGGNASVTDRTGLLVAIAALAVAMFALAIAIMGNQSARDRDVGLNDKYIELDERLNKLEGK